MNTNKQIARIIAVHKERYALYDEAHGEFYGKLKASNYYHLSQSPYPVTGDLVEYQYNESGDSMILNTLERKTFIQRFDASDGRIAPHMCIAVHGDGGLAVACHRRRDVCVMCLFVDICDDGVPEGVARDALDVHLLADSPHELAMLGVGQGLRAAVVIDKIRIPRNAEGEAGHGLRAAKEEVMPARCLRCRFFNVGSGNLRDGNIPFAELGLGVAHNGKVARGMSDIAANADDAAL